MKYPVLFDSADAASNSSQRLFLWLVRLEYCLLFSAAVFSLGLSNTRTYYIGYAAVFLASMGMMAYRSLKKPEKDWYRARALAESVKTLTWRFAMRAEPFDDDRAADARADFRDLLRQVLSTNREIADVLGGLKSTGEQLSNEMQTIREFALEDRKQYYVEHRINEQRQWYEDKAKENKSSAYRWFWISVAAYLLGLGFIITRVIDPSYIGWPTEPLVVFASAALGWTQIRKFNELSAAYTITAQEIGLAESLVGDARTNAAFSAAVNETELVFSREHTQWAARQHGGQ